MQVELIDIVTPRQYKLHGMWMGSLSAQTVFVHIHGLTSNMFNGQTITSLSNDKTAVLAFNNRGNGIVSKLKHLNPNNPKGYDSEIAGTAHEVFEDCVDDIEGAVAFAQKRGAKSIYLVGHSTGCQKSLYYLVKSKLNQNVSGVILICPISDYTTISLEADKTQYNKALTFARQMVKKGKPHELIPSEYWPNELLDAQRFISMYTPESSEEIFSYSQPTKDPLIYQSVETPMLVIFAGSDEYADRPAQKLQEWFDPHTKSKKYTSVVVENALHNLKGYEEKICDIIRDWTTT